MLVSLCLGIILLCILFIVILPAFAIAFVACIIGVAIKLVLSILGIGLRLTFSSIFLVCLAIGLLLWIF